MGLVLLLGLGLVAGWALLVAYTARMLRHPMRRGYAYAVSRGLPGDPAELKSARFPRGLAFSAWRTAWQGFDIAVWDVRGARHEGPCIIVLHGWGDSKTVMLSRLEAIASAASRVLMVDLPGHGDSGGVCHLGNGESGIVSLLMEKAGLDRAVLYGFSLGAGIAIVAASALPERIIGIIAEAPYRSAVTPARNVLRLRGLPYGTTLTASLWALRMTDTHRFDRVRWARAIRQPAIVLVLRGEQDVICPAEDGRAVAEAARGMYVQIQSCGHTDMWTRSNSSVQATRAVVQFLSNLERAPESAPAPSAISAIGGQP